MLNFNQRFRNHNQKAFWISLFWILGLIIGFIVSWNMEAIHNALANSLLHSDASVVGFLASLIFPFLLSAVFFKFSVWKGICILAFLKAFTFSYCSTTIVCCFGSAGWLLRCILAFSGSTTGVILLWFWIRSCRQTTRSGYQDLFLCLFLTLVVGFIDYCMISPFGVHLLSYY